MDDHLGAGDRLGDSASGAQITDRPPPRGGLAFPASQHAHPVTGVGQLRHEGASGRPVPPVTRTVVVIPCSVLA